jgi:hypothetical protein
MAMKLRCVLIFGIAGIVLAGGRLLAADSNPANAAVAATTAVYVPDTSHQNEPLPDGVLAWSSLMQETTVAADAGNAIFVFSFTNIATVHETTVVTNVTALTNITAATNLHFFWFKKISFGTNFYTANSITTNNVTRPVPVTILEVRPSCGCTTAQLPSLPWIIPPDTNGQCQDRQGLQTTHPQNQHSAPGGSNPVRCRPRARPGNGQSRPADGFSR